MDFELNENELPSEGNQLLFFTAHSAQGSKGSGSINIARIKATLIKNDFDIYSLYVDDRDSCGSFSKKIVHRALLNKMGYNSLPLYVYVKEGRIRYIHGKEFQVSDLDLALKD
ncbi:hypothetical protein GYB22_08190 [bacterium]|nr:hypothetical protein [bacterium]